MYMLTATLRNDGFSGFSKKYKSALFPSVGASWVLSNESFVSIPNLEYLKLRGTYGVNGNMTTRYSSLARVSTDDDSKFVFGDGSGTAMGQSMGSLANDNLRCENTKGLIFGLSLCQFNNRMSDNLNY